ncbi:MAG: HU family DNA-binding protein [Candidatus Eisenbacteria bacterium]|uniref:HU family DNA-binding protein n=1 Tax=Eiseniibacteriota bacterium TaxID=2212470 RepID=A0A937X9F3_UNCEI|nr:HU family DNA-binding protein [Candidatus Eisenbacteria bacterium]
MTKTELIQTLAKQTMMEKKQSKLFLEALTTLVTREIKKGGEVPLTGLGKFKVLRRKARMGRNPQTGEQIPIPAKKVVKFTVAKTLKDTIHPVQAKAKKRR